MNHRASGILLHISSLPGDFGIGDLGPEAYRFVDFLSDAGQSCWQILPINATEPVSGHSPYSSPSAFAGNILFISLPALANNGLLHVSDLQSRPDFSATVVDYGAVARYKIRLLNCAYERFMAGGPMRRFLEKRLSDFESDNAFWLKDYALFAAIKDSLNGEGWTGWPASLRGRDRAALKDFSDSHEYEIGRIKFLQYLFFSQWNQLKSYCAKKGVRMLGDMPIYMNMDSADVWANPQNYKLDDAFSPVVVAGVPPDYFSSTGQRWGNPVYDWGALRKSGYRWWVDRVRFNLCLFDMVRIDHFRGLVQCWEIPADEQTAVNGLWADVPTDELFSAIGVEPSDPSEIIAEDLGYITDDVRDAMRRFGFSGMKVLLFAFNGDLDAHPYLPHNHGEGCVVYTGTHDNNTALGWFRDEATGQEIRNLSAYVGKKISGQNVHWDLIRLAMQSIAKLAIVPMQDVLGLGSEARMNMPGTSQGNWVWRARPHAFSGPIAKKLRTITRKARRGE